jgi:hypothetical protein
MASSKTDAQFDYWQAGEGEDEEEKKESYSYWASQACAPREERDTIEQMKKACTAIKTKAQARRAAAKLQVPKPQVPLQQNDPSQKKQEKQDALYSGSVTKLQEQFTPLINALESGKSLDLIQTQLPDAANGVRELLRLRDWLLRIGGEPEFLDETDKKFNG